MNIFVYRPGAIGDTVLALPALAALRARFPRCKITYAGNTAMLPLLPVEQALRADDPRLLPLFEEPAQPWPGADVHVIFARQPVGLPGIQCDPLEALSRPAHMSDWLVDAIDPSFHDRIPHLQATPDQRTTVVMHPGAGSPAKRWPAERFAELARALDLPVAVVTGPAEPELTIPVTHELWDNLPLPVLARKLAGCRLLVSNDSGISHLAAALGVPTLAIYVSTDPKIWGIRGARTRIVSGSASVPQALEICRELLS